MECEIGRDKRCEECMRPQCQRHLTNTKWIQDVKVERGLNEAVMPDGLVGV